MDIMSLAVGSLATNCYLIISNSNCLIIDPGADADFISTTILEQHLRPQAILLTHGHFDHCLAILELKLNFQLPVYLHPSDLPLYHTAEKSARHWTGENWFKLPKPDCQLQADQTLNFNDISVKVVHTPGHTPGSVCFLINPTGQSPVLFTGDLLFAHGVGRTDFSYSNQTALQESLTRLKKLPQDTLIYPGHEEYAQPLQPALSFQLTQLY